MTDLQRHQRAAFVREQPLLWFFLLYASAFFGCAVANDLLGAFLSPFGHYTFPLALTLVPWLGLRRWSRRVTTGTHHSPVQ
jgi:hypothetical protein